MMSLRGLGNLGTGAGAAKLAANYYQNKSPDYYVKDLDHQGVWMGQGAKQLGLEGEVSREEFQLSLAGYVAGHEVQNAGKENRLMGWDCTFSAPKSVSIVWAGANVQHKQQIEQAHQIAVKEAFDYLEANTVTRRGKGGTIDEEAKLVACRFNHYTSREGDPQLHSHVVVSNFSARKDGSVGTIDSRAFYEHKMAAGALFQAELAYQMRKLGYDIENGVKGTFRVTNVAPEAERLFSKRDQQIDGLVQERGIISYAGSRGIVLATRANKVECDLSEREATWTKEAKQNRVALFVERGNIGPTRIQSDEQTLNQIGNKLTSQYSTFKERALLREAAVVSYGERNAQQVQALVKEAKAQGYVVSLDNGVLTTPDMKKIEEEIIGHIDKMVAEQNYSVSCFAVIERGADLGAKRTAFSREQQTAIVTATGKSGIAVVQGRAGTGKSMMLAAVRESYENAGWKVEGITLAGVAAQNLKEGAGIQSQTIASWLSKKEFEAKSGTVEIKGPTTPRTVVIMDEAGMVGSKQMSEVIQKVNEAGAKLILVGDEKQLQPIAAGGILHAIDKHMAQVACEYSTSIESIKRQREGWMRDVVKAAAQGETDKALKVLDEKGKINVYSNAQEARSALVDEFIEKNKKNFSQGLVLTLTRQDADKINVEIRQKLVEQGLVEKQGIEFSNLKANMTLAAGDRIMFTRNDYKLNLYNGQRATVKGVSQFGPMQMQVVLDNGETKEFKIEDYDQMDYGWASTTHKAQGATVEKAYVYGHSQESMASQQSTYVQISRAREETKLYIVAGERGVEREETVPLTKEQRQETLKEMKRSWSHDAAKGTTLERTEEQKHEVRIGKEREWNNRM